jgi:hypothetical protein
MELKVKPVDESPFYQAADAMADYLDNLTPEKRDSLTNYELAEELAVRLIERGLYFGRVQ